MEESYWKRFCATGAVEDYLQYADCKQHGCVTSRYQEDERRGAGEGSCMEAAYGGSGQTVGDGSVIPAYSRI